MFTKSAENVDGGDERCRGCGLAVAGGDSGCQAIMDGLLARDFSDALYFRVHRLFVDVYSLQHPDRYCVSFKSLAAHLAGLCWSLEHNGSRAVPSEPIRRWLERHAHEPKPPLPVARGALTVGHARGAADPVAYGRAVDEWARSTWAAYAPLHSLAREWVRRALAEPARDRRTRN
ncbi:MAG TPA: DUF5946 family protein [Vicinamibacterales bacterium]|nr:DUF5946 family protein [Vicinamibacterales bacterium]